MHDALSRRRPPARAFTALDLKSVAADGSFAGYAALFEAEDLSRDVIEKGAFVHSLRRRGPGDVRMLFQHDPGQPIGAWTGLAEDSRGLWAEGRLMLDVARAREVLALMREGALDGLSIGFKSVRARKDKRTGIRRIAEIDLWEISVVTFPMQPAARVTSFKAQPFADRPPTEREFERWLTRDAGLTRTEARAVMRAGLEGLATLRDAGVGDTAEARLSQRIREASRLLRGK